MLYNERMKTAVLTPPRAVRRAVRPQFAYRRRYDYTDYLLWPDGFRAEIVDGDIVTMSAPSPKHQSIVYEVCGQLRDFLKSRPSPVQVFPAPLTVRLFPQADGRDQSVFEPDITLVLDPAKVDASGVLGVPDMLVEVLSPSTALYDLNVKLDKYEEAGVPECWVIDPDSETVLVNLLKDGVYQQTTHGKTETIPVTVLPGCSVNLGAVL
jgi:Uma2 family endonuclease